MVELATVCAQVKVKKLKMLQIIRQYGKRFASISLAIFVLPMFSLVCANCISDNRSNHSTSVQISQTNIQAEATTPGCKHTATDGIKKLDHTGDCCDIKSADSDLFAVSEYFEQVKKVIFNSPLPEPRFQVQILVSDQTFFSPNLAHAKLSFRNPVLLS